MDPLPTMLQIQVQTPRPGETVVILYGELNEEARLDSLRPLRGRVIFDFAGLRKINSLGVRELLKAIEALLPAAELHATRCSPAIVSQLNMLPELSDRLTVESVLAPMECTACLLERELDIPIRARVPQLPDVRCDACGGALELTEPRDRYFAFLE